ncbi:hypothetical protein RRG08_052674 [Elysia crispata]|uniref:Uncharacterized protein n=1 Tax=Elysia crispata TaxID=231223 RepID=A0AAE1AQ97_9GAST|nr:hypothetical protein RRG08_052674 [Elysia crispata]
MVQAQHIRWHGSRLVIHHAGNVDVSSTTSPHYPASMPQDMLVVAGRRSPTNGVLSTNRLDSVLPLDPDGLGQESETTLPHFDPSLAQVMTSLFRATLPHFDPSLAQVMTSPFRATLPHFDPSLAQVMTSPFRATLPHFDPSLAQVMTSPFNETLPHFDPSLAQVMSSPFNETLPHFDPSLAQVMTSPFNKTLPHFDPSLAQVMTPPFRATLESCGDRRVANQQLDSTLSRAVIIDVEAINRFAKASAACARLCENVWEHRGLTLTIKLKVYHVVILSILLYASETWTAYSRHAQKLNHFHLSFLRRLLRIRWQDKISTRSRHAQLLHPPTESTDQMGWTRRGDA